MESECEKFFLVFDDTQHESEKDQKKGMTNTKENFCFCSMWMDLKLIYTDRKRMHKLSFVLEDT